MVLLSANQIYKSFGKKEARVEALRGVSLQINQGEMVAITGKSGSGKSTLLNIAGGMMSMDSGSLVFRENVVNMANRKALTLYRRNHVGFVVQYFALIPDLTVFENVALPLRYQGISGQKVKNMTKDVLEQMGVLDKQKFYPDELSGGQQQRVAIARAIVKNPELILADEPTGALDERTGEEVLHVFLELKKAGRTVVIVTHDEKAAEYCDRMITLKDGQVV